LLSHFNRRLYSAVKLARILSRLRGRSSGAANTDFRLPLPLVNRLLERILAGESHPLLQAIDSNRSAYNRGVSLIAILERLAPETFGPDATDKTEAPGLAASTQPEFAEL
jgi:hypothetical protein